jgi:hypothetical protein
MSVSHVWFSDYSICYIELGALSAGRVLPNGLTGSPFGEATVFLGYDWLVKSEREELSRLALHANVNERDVLAAKMIGQTIELASLSATGLEIEITLSDGVTLSSVSSNNEHPTWDVGFDGYSAGVLGIEDRMLRFRSGNRK